MSNIVEGVVIGSPIPTTAGGGIPIEATGNKELKVFDGSTAGQNDIIRDVLFAILNELVIANDRLFGGKQSVAESERVMPAYDALDSIRNRR